MYVLMSYMRDVTCIYLSVPRSMHLVAVIHGHLARCQMVCSQQVTCVWSLPYYENTLFVLFFFLLVFLCFFLIFHCFSIFFLFVSCFSLFFRSM